MHDDSIRMSWPLHPTPGIDDNPIFPNPCPFARLPPQKARKRKKTSTASPQGIGRLQGKGGLVLDDFGHSLRWLVRCSPLLFLLAGERGGGQGLQPGWGFLSDRFLHRLHFLQPECNTPRQLAVRYPIPIQQHLALAPTLPNNINNKFN